jgi:RNA polymerase sigma factor (sigma-70 family)
MARIPGTERTPSRDAHRLETAHAMLIALERLDERQRRAVELYFLRGRSRQQVAEELKTSEKAVSDLVHRGLRLMRGVLGPAVKYFSDARTVDPTEREPAHASD